MSLKHRLLFAILALVVASIGVNSLLLELASEDALKETINTQVERDLSAKRAQLTGRIESYISQIKAQLIDLSRDPFVVDAAKEFTNNFKNEAIDSSSSVNSYYEGPFKRTFDQKNPQSISVGSLISKLSATAKHFQAGYIVNNNYPLGEKDKLEKRNTNTAYDFTHQKYHSRFQSFLNSFGYYDIFIIDPDSGHVVYSVFKEIDYATDLKRGPFNSSGLAKAYTGALKLSADDYFLTDFYGYLPSYNAPASFISSPIYDGSTLVGVLIFQMPIDAINDLMTVEQKWREQGFGESGEIYLVGPDNTLRNESRFFIEDREGYLATLREKKVAGVDLIDSSNTTINHQRVDSVAVVNALQGKSGFETVIDYRGVPVVSSYGPVNYGPHKWAILSEIDEAEAYSSLQKLADKVTTEALIEAVILSLIAGTVAFFLSKSLTKPIDELGDRLKDMAEGEADLTLRLPKYNIAELDRVSDYFNNFVHRLQKIMSNIKASVDTVAAASTELGATTEQTSGASREQNNQTQQINTAISRIMSLVEENQALTIEAFENTETTRETTKTNTERADLAEENIRQLVTEVTQSAETLTNLQNEVKSIEDVLSVINSIADQTNLLALNAAIEAARAGEHGRGFAVVADEVRNLASKTQESTVTIQEQISQLTQAAAHSVESMNRASVSAQGGIHLVSVVNKTLNELLEIIANLSAVNQSVATAGDRQAEEMARIKNSTESLASASYELTQSSDNIANAANDLSRVAESLMSDTQAFKV
ncbi:MAG: methyl-accepting chemotaxis protein [Gammaproteobacteria bacterium]|nr:methyl-accepting chemotaxis protein [Gammaproteobacteria bacterium]